MLRETFEIMQKIGVPTGRLDYPSFASQRGGGRHEKNGNIFIEFRARILLFYKKSAKPIFYRAKISRAAGHCIEASGARGFLW